MKNNSAIEKAIFCWFYQSFFKGNNPGLGVIISTYEKLPLLFNEYPIPPYFGFIISNPNFEFDSFPHIA